MAESIQSIISNLHPVETETDVAVTSDEKRLLRFCYKLLEEAQSYQDELGVTSRAERVTQFLSSPWSEGSTRRKAHSARINVHKIRSVMIRQAGMLTESRPKMSVRSRSGKEKTALSMTHLLEGIWHERGMQQQLVDGVVMAQKHGYAPLYIPWDPSLDAGYGDIRMDFLQPSQVMFDPMVRRASQLQEGDYVIIKIVRTLTQFWEMYKRGRQVKPDSVVSEYEPAAMQKIHSPLTDGNFTAFRKPSRHRVTHQKSAIPRAVEYRMYFRDRTVSKDDPWREDPSHPDGRRPNYLFPGKRLIVWTKDLVLHDGNSRYWDGMYPVELLDWGIETEHAYGESEADRLRTLNEAMNSLIGGSVDNARLINNPPLLIDHGAMAPSEISALRRYGDRPGYPVVKRKGYSVERNPPGQMTNVVMGVYNELASEIERDSGMVEVTQGIRPPSLQSGIAIDTLMLAAQIVVRLHSRTIEDFISRVGQLGISRVLQFYTDRRIARLTGPLDLPEEFIFDRQKFLTEAGQKAEEQKDPGVVDEFLLDLFRDLRFDVLPVSSLAIAKQAKLAMLERWMDKGIVSRKYMLQNADVQDVDTIIAEADADLMKKAELQGKAMQLAQGGGSPGAPMGGGPKKPAPAERPIPAIGASGPGQTGMQAGGQHNTRPEGRDIV